MVSRQGEEKREKKNAKVKLAMGYVLQKAKEDAHKFSEDPFKGKFLDESQMDF